MAVSKLDSQSTTWLRRYTRVPRSHESLMTPGRSGRAIPRVNFNENEIVGWPWRGQVARWRTTNYLAATN